MDLFQYQPLLLWLGTAASIVRYGAFGISAIPILAGAFLIIKSTRNPDPEAQEGNQRVTGLIMFSLGMAFLVGVGIAVPELLKLIDNLSGGINLPGIPDPRDRLGG